MKRIIFLFVLFFAFVIGTNATAIICESAAKVNCDKVTKVRIHDGPWQDACFDDFTLSGTQVYEDDCMATLNNSGHSFTKSNVLNLISHEVFKGYKWTDKGTNTKHILEFVGNEVFYDGKLRFKVNENISAIIMEIPNSEGLYVKLGIESQAKPTVKTGPNYNIAIPPADMGEIRSVTETKAYPNPLYASDRLYLSSPTLIDETRIIDINGRVVYENKNDWEDTYMVEINDLQGGIYFVILRTSKFGLTISRKITVMNKK